MSHRSSFTFILKSDLVRIKLPAQAIKSPHFLVGYLALAFVKFGFALAIIYQLKRIFRTLRLGQIFKDENARRVRAIGLLTLGGAIVNSLLSFFIGSLVVGDLNIVGVTIEPSLHWNPEGLFTGLVLIVLAEIFRHGTALQAEQDLTV
jgi:MFS family permease